MQENHLAKYLQHAAVILRQGGGQVIYIVEDDENIRELVCYTLSSMVLPTLGFAESGALEHALAEKLPELLILDIMLPGKDGLTILKELRAQAATAQLPVLILSAKESEFDKVSGLNLGADDYLAKPFGAMELVARVKALLRRAGFQTEDASKSTLTFGAIEFDQEAHRMTLAGQPLPLTTKEFELFRLFLENPRLAFSREQLLDTIWGYHYDGESRTVDVHVASLRQKLGEAAYQIETIRGFGYRFQPGPAVVQ